MSNKRIYCAGALFNRKEKEEMLEIANMLEKHKFYTFLPQRDGLEFACLSDILKEIGESEESTKSILNKAIFALDVFQVLECDGLVLNMNGRVPDEGAMVEVGIAWSIGKTIVIYKDDVRTLISGSNNPLAVGLSGFTVLTKISEIPIEFKQLFNRVSITEKIPPINSKIMNVYNKGFGIFSTMNNCVNKNQVARFLIDMFGKV